MSNSAHADFFPVRDRGLRRLLLAAAVLAPAAATGQEYPARPIRIIVPFPAGGTADILPRIVAEHLASRWRQPLVVDNRPGAAGNIGAELVFKAEPDGYTLLSTPPPPLVINASLYPKLGFDPARFEPVSLMAAVPNVLLAHPKLPVATIHELIAHAKAHPDRLSYGSQGSGSTSHLTTEMFKTVAGGLRITHVPYKGTAPALAALQGGEVNLMVDNLGVSRQHVLAGRVKALAVCSERRVASLPQVPAMAEIFPGFVSAAWFGIVAPPRTPARVTAQLSSAIREALKLPEIVRKLGELSADPIGADPAAMAAYMQTDRARWKQVIQASGVKLD